MELRNIKGTSKRQSIAFLCIPLVLSSFTHLLNAPGFPDIFYDEGIYMRRAMHMLEGLGPQEGSFYDHPYFGQMFLAGVLWLAGYQHLPDTLASAQTVAALSLIHI